MASNNPLVNIVDQVNNYFFYHKNREIVTTEIAILLDEIGVKNTNAAFYCQSLLKKSHVVLVKKGCRGSHAVYKAAADIQLIFESARSPMVRAIDAIENTPEGVLMLQDIFIKRAAPAHAPVRLWDEAA